MKPIVLLICLVAFALPSQAQPKEEYKSAEKDAYYANLRANDYYRPKYPSTDYVLNYETPYAKTIDLDTYSANNTKIWVSARQLKKRLDKSLIIKDISKRKCIGDIQIGNIITYERKEDFIAFLYYEYKYTSPHLLSRAICVAVSYNGGRNWQYAFTGLYDDQPFAIKQAFKLPLIINSHTLQVEAALMRQTEQRGFPSAGGRYELIKDGIAVILDLDIILQDSDQDGLNDLLEHLFRTDPHNPDTNGNGISDNQDMTPRQCPERTAETVVYEHILNCGHGYDKEWTHIPDEPQTQQDSPMTNRLPTMLIITDTPAMQAVVGSGIHRTIIVSTAEYMAYHEAVKFIADLEEYSLSPMFRVDGHDNLWIINQSESSWGHRYLVKRTTEGWFIKIIDEWIS
jgi:hypothetical protein